MFVYIHASIQINIEYVLGEVIVNTYLQKYLPSRGLYLI